MQIEALTVLLETGRTAAEGGQWDDALAAYHALLERLGTAPSELRAEVLRCIGSVHYYRGDLDVAGQLLSESCDAAQACGSMKNLASALNFAAVIHQSLGQMEQAEATYARAHVAAEQAGHSRLAVMIEQNLGTLANTRGDSATALQQYEKALHRYEATGDVEGMAGVLNNIGMVHTDLRAWDAAAVAFERALLQAQQRKDPELLGTIQLNRAEMYLQQERFDDARTCVDQAFELFGRLGSRQGLGEAYKVYGSLFRAAGKLQLADAHLGLVVDIAEKADYLLLLAESLTEHALVYLDLGQNAHALRALNRSHRIFGELSARRELLDVEKRLDTLERSYLQIVQVWGESIDSKDLYTGGHCSRVADLTTRLAAALGFEGRDLTWLRMGAFLHDVGKTEVPAEVLNKTGKLTEREWEIMRSHTTAGDAIVAELDFPWDIRPIVRNHHEHYDGSGYPDGLVGEEIPLSARILCVADVYDALTTTRAYRAAYTPKQALEIMEQEAGRVTDPSLFRIFCSLLREDAALDAVGAG